MNIIALPGKLEEEFKDEFYASYLKQHQNMELSSKGRTYANMVGKAYFGSTFDEIMLQIQNLQEKWQEAQNKREEEKLLKEEALRKEQEALRKEQEALQKEQEALQKEQEAQQQKEEIIQKQKEQVLNLFYKANLTKEQIIQFMELEQELVEKIIEENPPS